MKKLFILVAVLGLFSCDNVQEDKVVFEKFKIQSPFKNIDIDFESFNVLNEKGGKIELAEGGYIDIPAGAFSNDSGQVLSGGIEIKFRDFKNPAEIIASGIPMTYDSLGTSSDFQSAGMYEIKAFQNGKEVSVTGGKQIEVGLTSARADADYNFYDLKEDGNWNYNFTCKPNENPLYAEKIEEAKKSLKAKEPIRPVKADDSTLVFDFAYNKGAFPELAAFKNVLWTPFNNAKAFNEVTKSHVTSVTIEKNERYGGVYNLKVWIKGRQTRLYALPVFIGDDYVNANEQFELSMEEYKKEWGAKQTEIARLSADQKFIRSSMITGMGIYNYDRIYKRKNLIVLNASFMIENKSSFQISKVYLVSNNKDVIYYTSDRFNRFGYLSFANNTIVAVLPNDEIGYCKITPDIKNVTSHEFKLTIADQKLESPDQINEFFESL